ncbi:unnamed protein product [Brugia pahangi]|uniref:Uncharacterized protein n=1 Tax=Brugia pahangi TaxID=6280 RepID=A0A0N4TMR5_BRUPA|nr:unnamed protein product [Brugia pahangi]
MDRAGEQPRNRDQLLRRLRIDTHERTDRQADGETDVQYVCQHHMCVLGRVSISAVVCASLNELQCNASPSSDDMMV